MRRGRKKLRLISGTYNFSDTLDIGTYVSRVIYENKQYMQTTALRRALTEALIDEALRSVSVNWNSSNPELSHIDIQTLFRLSIECLMAFNYTKVINSHRLRIDSERGREVINTLFDKFFTIDREGSMIDDSIKPAFKRVRDDDNERARFICDYIASMTDRQALDMYAKLTSAARTTIFGISF